MSLKKNREEIVRFKQTYEEYLHFESQEFPLDEDVMKLRELRSQLNKAIPVVISLINDIGQPTKVYYAPSPMTGGIAGWRDLLENLFDPTTDITQNVLDMLDKAIGRYDYYIKNGWKKWLNPLYWVGEIIRIPFKIIRFAGFDSSKLELSTTGKIYKAVAGFAAFLVSLIKLYDFLTPYIPKITNYFFNH